MRTIPELRDTVSDGTVLRGTLPADEVTTLVLSEPEPRPDGIRFRGPVPTGGPLVAVPAYLDPGGFPARMLLVTAELDPALRRQIRVECAELEAVLTRIDPAVVLPLLDHGLDPAGRPYLLVADPPPGTPTIQMIRWPPPAPGPTACGCSPTRVWWSHRPRCTAPAPAATPSTRRCRRCCPRS